jgi:hypothetical protein
MLNDLDKSLKALLEQELPTELVEQVTISLESPDAQAGRDANAINLFLYDVRENWELRSNEWQIERNTTGVTQTPPPTRVDCSYLITAWSKITDGQQGKADQEHLFLGAVMKVLLRHRLLPAGVLQGELEGQEPPVRAKPLQAGQLQSLGEFWQAIGSKPKALLNYTVTISVPVGKPVDLGRPVTDKLLDLHLKKDVEPMANLPLSPRTGQANEPAPPAQAGGAQLLPSAPKRRTGKKSSE